MASDFWKSSHFDMLYQTVSKSIQNAKQNDPSLGFESENPIFKGDSKLVHLWTEGYQFDSSFWTADQRFLVLFYFIDLLHRLAMKIKLKQQTIARACIYFRRFYSKYGVRHYDPYLLVPAALLLSMRLDQVVGTCKILILNIKLILTDFTFPYNESDIQEALTDVAVANDFNLYVYLPYRYLVWYYPKLLNQLNGVTNDVDANERSLKQENSTEKITQIDLKNPMSISIDSVSALNEHFNSKIFKELQQGWAYCNDMTRTDLIISQPPHVLALSSLYLCFSSKLEKSQLSILENFITQHAGSMKHIHHTLQWLLPVFDNIELISKSIKSSFKELIAKMPSSSFTKLVCIMKKQVETKPVFQGASLAQFQPKSINLSNPSSSSHIHTVSKDSHRAPHRHHPHDSNQDRSLHKKNSSNPPSSRRQSSNFDSQNLYKNRNYSDPNRKNSRDSSRNPPYSHDYDNKYYNNPSRSHSDHSYTRKSSSTRSEHHSNLNKYHSPYDNRRPSQPNDQESSHSPNKYSKQRYDSKSPSYKSKRPPPQHQRRHSSSHQKY